MYSIGLSSCGFALTRENFAALQASNLSAIEISMKPELYASIDYKEVSQLSREYEMGLRSPKTILRERELTFADFYNNATSLFAGQKPPIFSKPKENLGMWE